MFIEKKNFLKNDGKLMVFEKKKDCNIISISKILLVYIFTGDLG